MISDGGHDGCLLALLVIIFLCVTLIIFCLYFSKQKTLPQNEHLCHFKFKTLQVLNYLFPFPFFSFDYKLSAILCCFWSVCNSFLFAENRFISHVIALCDILSLFFTHLYGMTSRVCSYLFITLGIVQY